MFILAQISGFIAWVALFLSYYRKNTNKILFFHIISIIFYLLSYLFLGAWTGVFIIVLELIRDFLYYKTNKDNIIFLCTVPIHIALFIIYRNNIIGMIPIVASLIEGFSLTKSKKIIVPGAIFVYSMWIIYDINVGAYTSAFTQFLIVLSNLFILTNMIIGNNKNNYLKINSRRSLQKKHKK